MTTANDHDDPAALCRDFPAESCAGCGWFVTLCHCPTVVGLAVPQVP